MDIGRPVLPALFVATAISVAALPAAAAECGPLQRLVSLEMTYDSFGRPLIPITIGGKSKRLLVDTGGVASMLTQKAADEFGRDQRRGDITYYNVRGGRMDKVVRVPRVELGPLGKRDFWFVVKLPGEDFENEDIIGLLAPDVLMNYDVDFDFGRNRFSLISPDHCEGGILHWRATSVAVVRMRLTSSWHIEMPITLDGKRILGEIDTGADRTFMNMTIANRRFGLTGESPGVLEGGTLGPNNAKTYRYQFGTLTFPGIAVTNPEIDLLPDLMAKAMPFNPGRLLRSDEPEGLGELTLGMKTLSKLHMYIAYKERKVYFTDIIPQPEPGP